MPHPALFPARTRLFSLKALRRQDLRVAFHGEEGLDAGGVAREWIQLVSEELFDPAVGLFQLGASDGSSAHCYEINPSSELANEGHLGYLHFAGRILGKAVLDGHLVPCHLVPPLYKALLGAPLTLADLECVDHHLAANLRRILASDGAEALDLDFTVLEKSFGVTRSAELKPGGKDEAVTDANKVEYAHRLMQHIMFDRVRSQLSALVAGYRSVMPVALGVPFDARELELVMCGLPDVDVDDWRCHTTYTGAFAARKESHPVVGWFWELVEDLSPARRARLLQFATGSAHVPGQGFAALQGNAGILLPFTLQSMPLKESVFPHAKTCFNRVLLPLYATKEDLVHYVTLAIELEGVGFAAE